MDLENTLVGGVVEAADIGMYLFVLGSLELGILDLPALCFKLLDIEV